jgi:D-alanyl-D-alanine carboxypeptidase/D-alanyl-D-alanine-endopeptidase (penicillin-binding protein 4)
VRHDGGHAQVAFADQPGGTLKAARAMIGRHETLGAAEDAAQQIGKLLRGPLRAGVTGIFVADARTGEPLFAVNADDALNPASNVKMISTAAALELLGADFHYATRVLGPAPDATGAIAGDLYLLGSYDPTLAAKDFDDLATQLATRGVKTLAGDVVIGADPTRDGIFHASVPIEIAAGDPGGAPTVTVPAGMDLVSLHVTATTSKRAGAAHLHYQTATSHDDAGHTRIALAITGTIGKGGHTTYDMPTEERTQTAAYALRGAMRAHGIAVTGEVKIAELPDYMDAAVAAGQLPDELARHDSKSLAAIIQTVNKYSINWLADRVIMTAAALAHHSAPSMPLALDAMYGWLARHAHLAKHDVVVDTGSGLSYKTQLTPHELVAIVRAAAGFAAPANAAEAELARAWIDSLSISGTDGTLGRRFKHSEARGHIHGKTGTLNSSIALSGVLDLDPARPLAFAIVTNGNDVAKGRVRAAHEAVIGVLCKYLDRTAKAPLAPAPAPPPAAAKPPVDPELPELHELHEQVEPEPEPETEAEPASPPSTIETQLR